MIVTKTDLINLCMVDDLLKLFKHPSFVHVLVAYKCRIQEALWSHIWTPETIQPVLDCQAKTLYNTKLIIRMLLVIQSGISLTNKINKLTNKMNKSGPSTDPCGTPHNTSV